MAGQRDGRRGVFDVDEERALEALRLDWGDAYAVCFDDAISAGGPRWRAWRLDGETAITGATPDELNRAIRAHWQAMQ
jgi:hypothetical protein